MENLLIEEGKKRPYLWNIRCENYKTRSLRKYEFQEIADFLKKVWPQNESAFTSGK